METIITTSIPAVKFNDVESYFANCLSESIAALDNNDFANLQWYADCTLEQYFAEMQELWTDEGEYLGEGFNMIFAKIVLNDDTRADLENAFNAARDKEFKEVFEYDDETICSHKCAYEQNDRAEVEMAMQAYMDKVGEGYEVGAASYYEEGGFWTAHVNCANWVKDY
jgi:hypothetical protein